MSSSAEIPTLPDLLQKVNTWEDFMAALPPRLMESFGGEEQFFLTLRMLDVNTPGGAPISRDAFNALVAVRREKGKGFVPLSQEETYKLLNAAISTELLNPLEPENKDTRYAPNPLLKEAIIRFDKNEPSD